MTITTDDLVMEAIYVAAFLAITILTGWWLFLLLTIVIAIDFVMKCRALADDDLRSWMDDHAIAYLVIDWDHPDLAAC